MGVNQKPYAILFTLLWTACVICLGLMFLQQRVKMTVIWQTIPMPNLMIHASSRGGENAYKVPLAALGLNPGELRLAALQVMEDGVSLGKPDSARRNTARKGMGRYLIWEDTLQFSSSDNTSPLSNGRTYQIRLPAHISLKGLVAYGGILVLFTLWMLRYFPSFRHFFGITLINLCLISALFFGFEAFLKATEPRQPNQNGTKYPYDSNYAQINPTYYQDQDLPYAVKNKEYTWGVLVEKNQLGFREREFSEPKPADTCRIMVLGDSLTWGVGMKPEERYSNILEKHLNAEFPERKFEVLNFGFRGSPTTKERDLLRTHIKSVDPDWVLIGFCLNDPQPKSADYWQEKEEFNQRVMPYILPVFSILEKAGFPRIAYTSRTALDNLVARSGLIPGAGEGLPRTYEPASAEWKDFYQALIDMKTDSEKAGLPPPLFVVLNQNLDVRANGKTIEDSPDLPQAIRLTRQAERAAAEIGLFHINMEKEILEKVGSDRIGLNPLDGHPSALANRVYAEKIFDLAAAQIRAGVVCPVEK